jgi:hypothetical protein
MPDERAFAELSRLAEKAAYRTTTFEDSIKTVCDLIELYSNPIALYGAVSRSTMLGVLGVTGSATSKAISVGCQNLLVKPYRWIGLRQIDLNE